MIVPMCKQGPVDGIDGVYADQHQWVQGPTYDAPNPEDGQPAKWEALVCERCGVVRAGWERLAGPS